MITLILPSCVNSFPPRVSADGAAAGSAGWQREGESLRDRADSSSSGASDQDQGHRPRDSHTLQGTEEVTLILINHILCNWRILGGDDDIQGTGALLRFCIQDSLGSVSTVTSIGVMHHSWVFFPSVCVRVLWCQPSWSSRLRMEPCTQLSSNMETTWGRTSSSFRSSRSWTKWEYSSASWIKDGKFKVFGCGSSLIWWDYQTLEPIL